MEITKGGKITCCWSKQLGMIAHKPKGMALAPGNMVLSPVLQPHHSPAIFHPLQGIKVIHVEGPRQLKFKTYNLRMNISAHALKDNSHALHSRAESIDSSLFIILHNRMKVYDFKKMHHICSANQHGGFSSTPTSSLSSYVPPTPRYLSHPMLRSLLFRV